MNNPSYDFEAVQYPSTVSQFLRANPSYVKDAEKYESIEQAYILGRVQTDWKICAKHLPTSASSVLDIGCGVGGLDLPVYSCLGSPHLTLVDKARRKQGDQVFDVIATAKDLLLSNQVPIRQIKILDSSDDHLNDQLSSRDYDLIFSLRGLAFMFPYSTYEKLIAKCLRPGGTLILDVRSLEDEKLIKSDPVIAERFRQAGLPSFEDMLKFFNRELGPTEVIHESSNYNRVKVVRR